MSGYSLPGQTQCMSKERHVPLRSFQTETIEQTAAFTKEQNKWYNVCFALMTLKRKTPRLRP